MANLNVTYEQMRDAASHLKNGREEIHGKLNELDAMVNNLVASGYVTDQSSRAFDETFDRYVANAKGVIDSLDGMANFLIQAANAMQQTDEGLAGGIRGGN